MRTSLVLLGGLVGVGSYLVGGDAPAAPASPVAVKADAARPRPAIATPPPSLPAVPDVEPALAEVELMPSDEMMLEVHGLEPFEAESEFAMVFTAGGQLWMRVAEEVDGVPAGRKKFYEGEVNAVIAPVAVAALPPELRHFDRMEVLVDGTCAARVDGFAKIARAAGEAGEGLYDDEGNYLGSETWTAEQVEADGYLLAARLDGDCAGSWARAKRHAPAAIARLVDDPELKARATNELLVEDAQARQAEWVEQGGEGAWQDAVDVTVRSYEHAGTGEVWVFASATKEGGCGEPAMYVSSAYRVGGEDGSLVRVAEPEWSADEIRQVVDVDDDGEVEVVLGSSDGADLVDMTNTTQRSISVPYHSYGCGC